MTLPRGVDLVDPSDAYYYDFSPCAGWRCIVVDAFDIAVQDGRPPGTFAIRFLNLHRAAAFGRSVLSLITLQHAGNVQF